MTLSLLSDPLAISACALASGAITFSLVLASLLTGLWWAWERLK